MADNVTEKGLYTAWPKCQTRLRRQSSHPNRALAF